MSVYLEPKNPIGDLKRLTFPYTPQIDYSTDVKYDTYNTTHTNYQLYGYTRTENPQLNMQCKFTAHTTEHFNASMFAIRFLRTYTKMNYGRLDEQRGSPPRILRFFAYGEQMFNNVPVVINKFSITFPEDVDYVKGIFDTQNKVVGTEPSRNPGKPTSETVATAANPADRTEIYLPVYFQISIGLYVQQNLYKAVNQFRLEDFAVGKLGKEGYI